MKLSVPLALSALWIVSEPSAQTVFETQKDLRVESCVEAVANAESWNGFRLLLGADACYREGLEQDGTFLRLAGLQRSLVDLLMVEPSGEGAQRAAAELKDFVSASFQTEGLGPAELFRDDAAVRRLIGRLRDWRPELPEVYDPGWNHRENPNTAQYDIFANGMTAARVTQVERHASLLRNDEYYAATTELAELQRRNPSIESDSENYARARRLTARMTELGNELAPPPEPGSADRFEYRPDPNARFRQVFMGVNGPSRNGSAVFASRNTVLASWLARALSKEELDSVLEQIDFREQVLVSFHVGEAYAATGKVYITHLELESATTVRALDARVGMNELGCQHEPGSSYPFALAIADRVWAGAHRSFLFGSSTFRDGCQIPASASPND